MTSIERWTPRGLVAIEKLWRAAAARGFSLCFSPLAPLHVKKHIFSGKSAQSYLWRLFGKHKAPQGLSNCTANVSSLLYPAQHVGFSLGAKKEENPKGGKNVFGRILVINAMSLCCLQTCSQLKQLERRLEATDVVLCAYLFCTFRPRQMRTSGEDVGKQLMLVFCEQEVRPNTVPAVLLHLLIFSALKQASRLGCHYSTFSSASKFFKRTFHPSLANGPRRTLCDWVAIHCHWQNPPKTLYNFSMTLHEIPIR